MSAPPTTHKRYAISILAGIAALILIVVLTNRVVDPYGIWPTPRIPQFNAAKTRRDTQDYLFKSTDLVRQRSRTLFIGTSRTAFAMTPDSQFMQSHELTPAYNGALRAANPATIRALLEHAVLHNPQLETVVWGIDFFSFSENVQAPAAFSPARLMRASLPMRDLVNTHLSARMFAESLKTVIDNRRANTRAPYTELGQLTSWTMEENVRKQGMAGRFEKSLGIYLNSTSRFAQFQFSEDYWDQLLRIRQLTSKHSIVLKIYVSPVHMALFEAMYKRQIWDDYLTWLQRLATEFGYWDYSLPNQINTEIIDDNMRNYWDVSHYRAHVGEHVLKDLFDPDSIDTLGTEVNPTNATAHSKAVDTAFHRWREQHPEIQQLVNQIAR